MFRMNTDSSLHTPNVVHVPVEELLDYGGLTIDHLEGLIEYFHRSAWRNEPCNWVDAQEIDEEEKQQSQAEHGKRAGLAGILGRVLIVTHAGTLRAAMTGGKTIAERAHRERHEERELGMAKARTLAWPQPEQRNCQQPKKLDEDRDGEHHQQAETKAAFVLKTGPEGELRQVKGDRKEDEPIEPDEGQAQATRPNARAGCQTDQKDERVGAQEPEVGECRWVSWDACSAHGQSVPTILPSSKGYD